MTRRLPDLGILAAVSKDELIGIVDAFGLDPAKTSGILIGPDGIRVESYGPPRTIAVVDFDADPVS